MCQFLLLKIIKFPSILYQIKMFHSFYGCSIKLWCCSALQGTGIYIVQYKNVRNSFIPRIPRKRNKMKTFIFISLSLNLLWIVFSQLLWIIFPILDDNLSGKPRCCANQCDPITDLYSILMYFWDSFLKIIWLRKTLRI